MDSLNKIVNQHIDHCSNEEKNEISCEKNHISLASNLNLYQTLSEIKIKN
jgi:hypothetical protein